MASTDIIEFYQTWNQSSAEAVKKQVKDVGTAIDMAIQHKSPVFARFNKVANGHNPKWEWMEEYNFQNWLSGTLSSTTLTFTGNIMGEAIANGTLRQHVKKHTLLQRPSDGLMVKVTTDVDYDAFTCTVAAHGNSGALSDNATAEDWQIMGQASDDYDTTYVPRGSDRFFRWCSIQTWKEFIEMPYIRSQMKMENVADEFQRIFKKTMEHMATQLASSGINMLPVYSGGAYKGGLETQYPTMTGMLAWKTITEAENSNLDVYVNNGGDPPDLDDINNLAFNLERTELVDFNTGDWIIACHPVQHQYISDLILDTRRTTMADKKAGYRIESIFTKLGKELPIVGDYYMPVTKLAIVDAGDCDWRYYGQGQRVIVLPESTENTTRKKVTYVTQGVRKHLPRQIGVLYGLPTSYSS